MQSISIKEHLAAPTIERPPGNFSPEALKFWGQYGITTDVLQRFNVTQPDPYKMIFAYNQNNGSVKYYNPFPNIEKDESRFWWKNKKADDFVFGLDQLDQSASVVYITGGEKDTMTLTGQGVNAISVHSETAEVPVWLINELKGRFAEIRILYDSDRTGREYSEKWGKKYGIPVGRLPLQLIAWGGKDVSDLIKFGLPLDAVTFEMIKEEGPAPVTLIRTVNNCLMDAQNQPEIKNLFGNLWNLGEITILAGDTGVGKTILAVTIADAITRGRAEVVGQAIQVQPMKILYYDFEMSDRQILRRYQDHTFSDDFLRVVINPESTEFTFGFEDIQRDVQTTDAKVIIVDNIAALHLKNTTDPDAALTIMRGLKELQIKQGITSLIIAHVPKIPPGTPLNINHLAGSKHLANFIDGLFFIGKSKQGPDIRYIKHVKTRVDKVTDVFACQMVNNNGFVTLEFMSYANEEDHLERERGIYSEENKAAEIQEITEEVFSDPVTYTRAIQQMAIKFDLSESAAKRKIRTMSMRGQIIQEGDFYQRAGASD